MAVFSRFVPKSISLPNFISLLEKYFFSVEKLFFSNWALSEALFDAFLLVFDLLWLLSVNTKKFYVFILASTKETFQREMSFDIRQKNIRVKRFFSRSSIASASSACHCPTQELKYHIKELINALVWKKYSNLKNYFNFYQYIYSSYLKLS